jgi:hypothetical protein
MTTDVTYPMDNPVPATIPKKKHNWPIDVAKALAKTPTLVKIPPKMRTFRQPYFVASAPANGPAIIGTPKNRDGIHDVILLLSSKTTNNSEYKTPHENANPSLIKFVKNALKTITHPYPPSKAGGTEIVDSLDKLPSEVEGEKLLSE